MIAGGDHTIIQRLSAARLFSPRENNVGANAPTMQFQTFANEIRRYNVKTWCICNIGTPIRPIWFCSKICYVGGRIVSAPTQMVPPNDRAEISVGVGVVRPTANQNPMIAGGDHTMIQRLSAARLFSRGENNVGAFAPTMQYQTFANEIRRYNAETLYIVQHYYITRPIRFCLQNDKNYSSPVTNGRIREVRRPATTRDRLLTAPVRGLSSLALAVPMTWAAVP